MTTTIEAAVSLAAAAALIVLATFLVDSARTWGRDHHLRDIPAGILLGTVSLAQMFLPLEPFPGVIIDLRIVPVVLAGAFLHRSAALIAMCMAITMRWGIGGTGMVAGILGITLAGLIGQIWQFVIPRLNLPAMAGFLILGVSTTVTMLAALLLPAEVTQWFFRNAAPVLGFVYIVCLPFMAWILGKQVRLETGFQKTGREALKANGLRVMSHAALLRHLSVENTDSPEDAAVAVLTVEIPDLHPTLQKNNRRRAMEAILLRTKKAVPEVRRVAYTDKGHLLLPVPRDMLQNITLIVKSLKQEICGTPLFMSKGTQLWPSCKIGLVPMSDIDSARPIRPSHILRSNPAMSPPRITSAGQDVSARRSEILAPERSATAAAQFDHISEPDLLFLKASLLSRSS